MKRFFGDPDKNNQIRIRGLRIDPDSRKVYVNEVETTMTAKEFDLLHLLARHPYLVFSKEQLFEKIWGFGALGDLQTVTVHIRKIREKIESDASDPIYIETVWGAGYRFKG
jgi:DNA-binding response OmpR family regulator